MKKIAFLLILVITFSGCKSSQKTLAATPKTIIVASNPIQPTSNSSISIEPNTIDLATIDLTTIDLETLLKPLQINDSQANRIIDYAFAFDGVRYKRGGTTKEGMDCSGLVVTTFDSENISLPRISRDIALTGSSIGIDQVIKGDLLFFATRKNSRTISHVGIVTTARDGFVEFIHASTSNGVIVSNMAEKYWYFAFIQARRVLI